jgi:four helix bundle protein
MFEHLRVYSEAVNFADSIADLVESFDGRHRVLADQLTRASISIPLNTAEGNGRSHAGDRRQFFVIARGSVHECVALLELCRRRGLMDDAAHAAGIQEPEALGKMLSGLISGLERRRG